MSKPNETETVAQASASDTHKAERLHLLLSTLAHDSHSAMVHGLDKGKMTAAFNWGAFLKNAVELLPEILAIIEHFKGQAPEPKLASDELAKK